MRMSNRRTPSQLPLELTHSRSLDREDLAVSASNETAVSMIDAWPDWPGSTAVLAGPVGSGKSHLAAIWKEASGAVEINGSQLTDHGDTVLNAISSGKSVLIEDIRDSIDNEAILFHILNLVRQENAYCLITSRFWPKEWMLKLADLKSRMLAAQVIELYERLVEAEKEKVGYLEKLLGKD